jgi:dTDP-4-dehydrorhamnose reductase
LDEKAVRRVKILLIGKDGQIGSRLRHSLAPIGNVLAFGRNDLDLTDLTVLQERLDAARPDIIVNAAAYTDVDRAELEPAFARAINCDAVALMATYAARKGAGLVHYSTDYVFDGKKDAPYVEQDSTAPLNVYGATKRDGEIAVRSANCRHLILRTSWIYSSVGSNFARTILRLARERDTLQVVDDQIGSPTSARLVAGITTDILMRLTHHGWPKDIDGTFHVTASGATSWYGFAQLLVEEGHRMGMKLRCLPEGITAVKSARYKTAAERPLNSRLSTEKILGVVGGQFPMWAEDARMTLSELARGAIV